MQRNHVPGEHVSIEGTVGVPREGTVEVIQPKEANEVGFVHLLSLWLYDGSYILLMLGSQQTVWCVQIYHSPIELLFIGPQQTVVCPDLPFTSWIVIHLVQMLELQTGGMGFHVFMDRFYTSHQLVVELHEMKMQTIGTVMTSWKYFPTAFRSTYHEYCAYQKNVKIMCLSFQGKCLVTMEYILWPTDSDGVCIQKEGTCSFWETNICFSNTSDS